MTAKRILIFDLDGVILSERDYWRVADATVQGLAGDLSLFQETPAVGPVLGVIPLAVIDGLKSRGVNSNWDLTLAMLMAVLALGLRRQTLEAQRAIVAAEHDWAGNVSLWQPAGWHGAEIEALFVDLWSALGQVSGHGVLPALNKALPIPGGTILSTTAHARFQQELAKLAPPPSSLVPLTPLRDALTAAAGAGFVLGVATGRPKAEAISALDHLGLTRLFDPSRLITFDAVAAAQRRLGGIPLGKPHPYCLLQAAYPECDAATLCGMEAEARPWLIYIGDAGSDLACAQAAGAQSWMVLSGCADPASADERRRVFLAGGATRVDPDVLGCLRGLMETLA
jgi:phosphoglycolate phosphatase-like HAD superfamily hydrolase